MRDKANGNSETGCKHDSSVLGLKQRQEEQFISENNPLEILNYGLWIPERRKAAPHI